MTSISHHDSETGKVELMLPTTLGVSESETKWLFSEYFKVLYLLVIAVYKGSCAKVKFSPDFFYSISGRVDFSDGGVDFGLYNSDIENWREDRGHKTFWPNIWIIVQIWLQKNSIVVTVVIWIVRFGLSSVFWDKVILYGSRPPSNGKICLKPDLDSPPFLNKFFWNLLCPLPSVIGSGSARCATEIRIPFLFVVNYYIPLWPYETIQLSTHHICCSFLLKLQLQLKSPFCTISTC